MKHLYLHVPFCQRRCSYCDFSIAVRKRIPAREYVDAVLQELKLLGTTDPGRKPGETEEGGLDTLYLGGGTPSLLPPEAISLLLTSLRDAFHVTSSRDDVEVTLEANPEDVTSEIAAAWRRAGVNRVSLGAQSFNDGVLKWMHRSHDSARIGDAVRTLRAVGFDNISLDLIFALPAELERDWVRDLDRACSLRPAHLSLYGLTVEERTPLARWISRGAAAAPLAAISSTRSRTRVATGSARAITPPTGRVAPIWGSGPRRTRSTGGCAPGISPGRRRIAALSPPDCRPWKPRRS